MPDVEWHQTATLDEATALLDRLGPSARILAGGTDLLVDLKTGRACVEHLVALPPVPELHGITRADTELHIGAATTIADLIRSPLVANGFSPLLDAATKMAAPPIRNAATIGGNIASAVPCADMPPVLMVMGARLLLRSASGQRTMALRDFLRGPRLTALDRGELLTTVIVPSVPPGSGVAYERFGLRNGNAIPVAAVAAVVRLAPDGTIADTQMALGAVAPVPKPVDAMAATLTGRTPDHAAFADAAEIATRAAEPISDVRGSADFRRRLVGVLARRALAIACQRAREPRS